VTFNRRSILQGAIAAPFLAGATAAASKQQFKGGDWGQWFKDWELKDFGMIGYYADDNVALKASGRKADVVFLGDSITEGWFDKHPAFFNGGKVDRGIGGQTSSQMVLRMMSDVLDLRPKAVHIMAGTNDVAGNTGPMTPKMTGDNFRMMHDLARANGIKVLIASVPPAASFPWREGLETKAPIAALNRWLRDYAAQVGATYVDYWPVLDDGTGAMKPGLASDGVHPTEAGYTAMETVVTPIIQPFLV
jgi:lysophospholipase L1-like esterase